MDAPILLFSQRSLVTMLHGLVFGGGALMGLAAALFYLHVAGGTAAGEPPSSRAATSRLSWLLVGVTGLLWMAVLGGTYLVFPPYRATPPEGLAELSAYPRSFLLAGSSTAWLHAFAMEIKEHVPWSAAMLSTAVAFVQVRTRGRWLADPGTRGLGTLLLWICFGLAAVAALLGTFVNKVAPLQ